MSKKKLQIRKSRDLRSIWRALGLRTGTEVFSPDWTGPGQRFSVLGPVRTPRPMDRNYVSYTHSRGGFGASAKETENTQNTQMVDVRSWLPQIIFHFPFSVIIINLIVNCSTSATIKYSFPAFLPAASCHVVFCHMTGIGCRMSDPNIGWLLIANC